MQLQPHFVAATQACRVAGRLHFDSNAYDLIAKGTKMVGEIYVVRSGRLEKHK